MTYETQILTRDLPESIVIVGAGAIGMEFGYVLKNYGVDVTIVEFLDRALPNEDADVSKEITKQYKKLGVTIPTVDQGRHHRRQRFPGHREYTDARTRFGRARPVDKVLHVVGFAPRVEGFGLENTGVQLTERGAIAIDDHMRTNVPHIYAIGDVTAKLQLAHVAEAQGVVAAETIAGAETLPLGDYRMMPRATFCQPQVASVRPHRAAGPRRGLRRQGGHVPVHRERQGARPRRADRLREAVADAKYGELLGGHLIGAECLRAAAGADPGAEVGSDRQRTGAQRAHPPDAV